MSQSCTYTFKGPDGRKMTIEGASALKAYLATGGLEFLLGEARADLARRPEQVLASQGREGDWNRLPGTHATKAAAEATVKVKVNGAKGTKPNPAWREYEFRIGQGRDDQWYVDARKRPGAASMKLSDKIIYEGVTRSANRQIDTPEFKTWSGGNLVVLAADASKHQFETGKPVVVEGFHGTRRNFDRVDTAQASAGYFLTSKPLVADEYAGVYPEGMGGGSFPLGGNVQRQYVRMDNPLVVNARGASFNRVDTRAIPGYPLQMSNTDAINQWAKSRGYDGVIYKDLRDSLSRPDGRNAPPSNVYVTFKPSFVKSAIGNSGEYSPQEESFLASRDRVTETPEFKAWFGDSKVVDAEGKPLVVYHGTNSPGISKFRMGSNEGGAWFAADPEVAEYFGEVVYPVYLSIQNPLPDGKEGVRILSAAQERWPGKTNGELLRSLGYDGLSFNELDPGRPRGAKGTTWMVVSPTQIKSAIGNRGTFSLDDPDIRRSEGRQELPRGYVGPVSEEERERGRLVARLEGEAYKAWADGRDRARDEVAREIADGMSSRDGAARLDDGIIAEVALITALQRVAPGQKYDPEKHPFFSEYRELASKVEAARIELRKMVDARVGPPEFDSMRQLADFDRPQVRTPEFRRWFGDSKVTDGQGRPLIVFHGTNKDLSEFATVREAGAVRNNNWFGQLGSWFAAPQPGNENYEVGSAESTAEAFSELRGDEGSAVYPVYLSIQNPYEVEGYESLTEERDDAGGAAAFRQMLVKQGYDGVVVRDSDTDGGQIRDDWVAFYPTQIKSAIGNTGAFAADNPDITKSSGRDVRPLSIEQDSREWAVDGEPTITLNKANFGGRSGLEWVDGDNENYVTSIAAYGDARGHEMLRWLKDHTGKPSFAVSAVDDAIGFYERMGEIGLMSGYTQDTVDSFFGIDFGDGEPQRYAGDVRFDRSAARRSAERSPLGFYSALAKGIDDLPTKQAPAGAWKAAIKGLVNKGAAKADEVEWSGINDWLDLQQGKVSKDQVSEYLKQGGVQVEEVVLGDQRAAARALRVEEVYPEGDQWTVLFDDGTSVGISQEIAEDEQSAEAEARILLEERGSGVSPTAATKYSQYTLPGGENYREVLLTLPPARDSLPAGWSIKREDDALGNERWIVRNPDGAPHWSARTREQAIDGAWRNGVLMGKAAGDFRSSHWDQPNVLAHIRVNDRTDADGKRVLFVEELQSDWGQEGKKRGFGAEWKVEETPDGKFQILRNGQAVGGTHATKAIAERLLEQGRINDSVIPTAPFVGKTDGWLNLALKRVMVMAAEGGYDKVAFVNGEQSAERFSLDKQLESVSWRPAKTDRATITIRPKDGAEMVGILDTTTGTFPRFESAVFGGESLESVLGKELAERVMASPEGKLADDGLKIEAKGMRAFYDTIVPTALKKLLPKVGGGQMGNVRLPQRLTSQEQDSFFEKNGYMPDEEPLTQPGFEVTDAMREKVADGLPLFSRDRAQTQTPEFKRWFGDSKVVDAEGKPLVVYHGTQYVFSAFDPEMQGDTVWSEDVGFFFTNDPSEADAYAMLDWDRANPRPNVMPVFLSIQNPMVIRLRNEESPYENPARWYDEEGRDAAARAQTLGHDGLVVVDERTGFELKSGRQPTLYIAFRPEQIKSAIGNSGAFDPSNPDIRRSAERSPLGFYSALAKGIEGLPTKQAPAGAWKAAIKGLVNKGAAKADEVEWSGINDWLDLQQGKVTKQQVAEYLEQGGVQVEETVLGNRGGWTAEDSARLDELEDRRYDLTPEEETERSELIRRENAATRDGESTPQTLPKYGQYTLPGGENYREVLLTLPTKDAPADGWSVRQHPSGQWAVYAPQGYRLDDLHPTREAALEKVPLKTDAGKYNSSHWDQPNVLAHIRVNDRTDADGKRVLFVEELQSDWGQEGKKKGFRRTLSAAQQKRVGELNRVTEERDFTDAEQAEYDSLRDGFSNDAGLPAAPFVTKTEGWLNLALKRVMIMAAEGGYDKVAFVNGEQSADRYDLSKQVNYIQWNPSYSGGRLITLEDQGGKEIGISADPDGTVYDSSIDGAEGKKLDEVLGKELADKIMASDQGDLRGLELKVGGKGMKAFYDTIVPAALKKLLPKVGGGRIEAVNINSEFNVFQIDDGLWGNNIDGRTFPSEKAAREAAGMPQPGFDVTDAMREKVADGLPLFSRDRPGINVRSDGDNRYADLIVDGLKTVESRDSDSLRPYVGKTVGIVRTGEGRARLIGSAKVGEPTEVDAAEFRARESEHMVPEGSRFDIKPGSTKWLYPLTEAKRFDEDAPVDSRGIVSRRVRFSRDRASWTKDRIDSLLSAHAYTMDDGRSKAYAGFVSPEDFLRATTPADSVESLEAEKRPLDEKELAGEVQPIFLKGEPRGDGTWKTTGHEGRHRMMALRDAGVRRVPVVFDVGYGLTREPLQGLYVTPQRWSGAGQAQGGFFVDSLIPISYKHASELRDTFAGDSDIRFSRRRNIDTPEFRKWFGNSKVVNGLGQPRVVYHGTAADVAIFDMGRAGQTYGLKDEKAFFFTGRIPTAQSAADDATGLPAYASKYAYQGFGGGDQGDYGDNYSDEPYDISADYNGGQNLMPVYLSLQNPLIVDAPYGQGAGTAFENGREAPGQLIERAKREGYDGIIIRGKYRNFDRMARIQANAWTSEADKKKYLDGLAREDARKHQTDHYFIAFRSDQIKSAIGNVGAYGQRPITEEEANRFGMGAMEADFRQYEGDIRFSVDRDYRPEKTVKAYKLFRMDERRPGELFPLFVDADKPVPMGEWLSAQAGPLAAGGKVKSKLGPLAYRPGWHAGDLPVATHIGMKKSASDGKPGLRNPEHVWAEVEMAADVDWQAEANKRGTNKDGKVVPVKAHITDEIPRRGFYRYKTNPNMTGNWLIGGEMRVLRLLSDSEVQRINKDAGAADLPRKEPLDLNRFGFGPNITKSAGRQTETPEFRRWFGDSKVVDKSGQPLVVYHGTYSDNIEVFDRMFMREKYGREALDQVGTWFSDRADDDGAGMYVGGNGANIVPAYLAIKNPWTVRFQGLWNKAQDLSGQPRDERPNAKSVAALDKWMDDNDIDGIRIKYDGRGDDEFANQDVWVARRPDQIKSAIGNSGAFDPTNPDITKSADRDDRATSAWQSPSASKFDDWVYKLQDKQIDTKRVVDEIKDVAGALADDLDVYLQEELFHGRAAKRTEDFVNKELRPLVDAMAKDGLKIEDLDTFLHARHAREANAVIAQRNPEIQDGGSGMTNQDAADYFANLDEAQRRKLEAAAAKVDAILAETRKMMVDYQLESPDVIKGWGQMFQHYVPLMREDEGAGAGVGIGQGFSIKGREVKSRTGSTRKVVDIFANIAMQRERTIVRGEKNRVSQALHGLAAASPNKEFWTVDKVPTTPTFNPATGLVEDRPDTLFKMRDNVIVSKVLEQDDEGRTVAREKAVIFNEKNERAVRMAAALKNLDAAQLEGLMGASAAVTRYFASINTQYNPVFGIINLMRDVQGAIVNLNTTELKDDKLKVARGTMSALMGIMADARKARRGEAGTSEWSALWEDFQSVGGQTGYRQLFQTSADRAKDIQRALNPDAWMDSRWGRIFTAGGTLKVPLSVAMKGARWLFDLLSDYNLAMENGIRLSAYKVALDKGMSRERAASLAKNLTVNFNRKGQVGQQAGALYAFFNAAMQGTARLGQVLFEMEPGKAKTIRLSALGKKVVYGGMLLGTTQALALAAAGFSDDDPPDFVRERSLIIPTGGKTYISIPMPLGLHVIPNIGRVTTEWALGGFKNTPQRVASLLGTFADSFNPIGNAGWSMQTLAPTALDPLVALTENKDWQGRPIAKESMNRDMPGPQLYRDTATSWGRLISESINYLSGGDKYSRGVLSPTPDQIDYLIGQLTGGVGREISKVEQTAFGLVRGEEVPTYKIPLVGRLIGDSGSQASEGTAFYANAQKLNKLETEIKLLREDGKTAEAQALRASRPEAYLMTQANYAERAIQRLRKEKSELIKDGAPREKIREIEERITARMAGLNRAMEALEAAR